MSLGKLHKMQILQSSSPLTWDLNPGLVWLHCFDQLFCAVTNYDVQWHCISVPTLWNFCHWCGI